MNPHRKRQRFPETASFPLRRAAFPMTTANKITLARLAILPAFLFCIYGYTPVKEEMRLAALILYLIASASDLLDGWYARRFHQISRLGKRLDPLADKLLVNLGYIFVASNPHFSPGIPLWAPPVFLARDVYIALGAYFINERYGPFKVSPRLSGKTTTALQMATMIATLAALPMAFALLIGAVVATFWSTVDYYIAGYTQVQEKKRNGCLRQDEKNFRPSP